MLLITLLTQSILLGAVFTSVDASWHIVVLQQQKTWYSAASECHNNYSGHLVGARDPVFQDEKTIKSYIKNRTVWTGSYKSFSPNTTRWLSFKGCYEVSSFRRIRIKPKMITRVYDCYSECFNSSLKGFGINTEYCFCLSNLNWRELSMSAMEFCSVDVDGNVYGNSNNSAAMYEIFYHINSPSTLPCASKYRCMFTKESCYRKGYRYHKCRNGRSLSHTSWIDAQRDCVTQGSLLVPYENTIGCIYQEATYFRKYENIKDLMNDTVQDKTEMVFCQTIKYRDGLEAQFFKCEDSSYNFAGLCKSYNTSSVQSTRRGQQTIITAALNHNYTTSAKYESTFSSSEDTHSLFLSEGARTVHNTDNPPSFTTNATTKLKGTTVISELDGRSSEIASNKTSKLAVGISIPLVAVVVTIILAIFIYRRKRIKQSGARKTKAATNATYELSISQKVNSNFIDVPGHGASDTADVQASNNSHLQNNYHVLEKQKEEVVPSYHDEYYISRDSVYDQLNERRQRRKVQQNEYGTVNRGGNDEDLYRYDSARVTGPAEINGENHYHTTANISETTEGGYDLTRRGDNENDDTFDMY